DPDREQVRVGLDALVLEQAVRDLAVLDGDLGRPLGQPLAGSDIERDARPAPVVDEEAGRDERLRLRQRIDLRLLAIALDLSRGDPARTVLAADDMARDLRPGHLDGAQ